MVMYLMKSRINSNLVLGVLTRRKKHIVEGVEENGKRVSLAETLGFKRRFFKY